MLSGSATLAAISPVGLSAAQCPNWVLAPIWFAIALILAETGFRFELETVRWEAHMLALFGLGAAFLYDLFDSSTIWGASKSLVGITPVIASYYYLRYRTILHKGAVWEQGLTRAYLWVAALLTVLMVQQELGRVLIPVAWLRPARSWPCPSFQGFCSGEPTPRVPQLRCSPVSCLPGCFTPKCGVLLLGALGLYTRFRETIRRYF